MAQFGVLWVPAPSAQRLLVQDRIAPWHFCLRAQQQSCRGNPWFDCLHM